MIQTDTPIPPTLLIPLAITPLDDLAADISEINRDHGFYEDLPVGIATAAKETLDVIKELVGNFEAIRNDPNFQAKLDGGAVKHGELEYNYVKLLLIISEIIEAIEALELATNAGDDEALEHWADHDEEVADVLIRVLDYAHSQGIATDSMVAYKVDKNRNRPYKHGKNF